MLYIVATPIGNLDDLSIRQARTLLKSDIILAEDTRSAQILLDAIQTRFTYRVPTSIKLISYYKEKEFEKLPEIINWLKEEKKIALISESGMPLISDPGYLLVKTCIKEKLPFTVIPGPSAVTTALLYSGFNPNQFTFLGFLPKKQLQIEQLVKQLNKIKEIFPEMIFVFYESPQRIKQTLECIVRLQCRFEIVICRELTKKFEEVIRATSTKFLQRNYKGELTVIIR